MRRRVLNQVRPGDVVTLPRYGQCKVMPSDTRGIEYLEAHDGTLIRIGREMLDVLLHADTGNAWPIARGEA